MADDGVRKQVVVYRFLIEVARDLAVNLAVTDEQEKPLVGVDEANDVVDGVGQDGIDAAFLREVFGESLKLAKCPEDVLVFFLSGAIRRGVLGVKGETHAERADGEFVLVRKRRFFLYSFAVDEDLGLSGCRLDFVTVIFEGDERMYGFDAGFVTDNVAVL